MIEHTEKNLDSIAIEHIEDIKTQVSKDRQRLYWNTPKTKYLISTYKVIPYGINDRKDGI